MKSLMNVVNTTYNQGVHCRRQLRAAWQWIDWAAQEYDGARLYHVVFASTTEAKGTTTYDDLKAVLEELMRRLRRSGIRCTYKAAKEDDSHRTPDGKGIHLHAFIICEGRGTKNPDAVINRSSEEDGGWLHSYAKERGVWVMLNPPQDPMHRSRTGKPYNYARLSPTKPARMEDAKKWICYMFKKRDKPSSGEVYSSSRGIPTTKRSKDSSTPKVSKPKQPPLPKVEPRFTVENIPLPSQQLTFHSMGISMSGILDPIGLVAGERSEFLPS